MILYFVTYSLLCSLGYDYVYLRYPLRFKFKYYSHEGTAEPIISHFSTHISMTNEHICDDYGLFAFQEIQN